MISINKDNGNSLIASMFLCETMLCSMIVQIVPIPNISVWLMMFLTVVSFVLNKRLLKMSIVHAFIPWTIIIGLLCVSGLSNGFDNVSKYMIYFCVFGTTAAIISINTINPISLYKYVIIIQTLYLIIYFARIRRPFLNSGNAYYADSMGIAYAMVTEIYLAIIAYFNRCVFPFRRRYHFLMIIDTILSIFVILIDCRSRGPIIAVVIAAIMVYMTQTKGIKKIVSVIIVGVAIMYCAYHFIDIVQFVYGFFKNYNIEIAALKKIIFLNQTDLGVLNGRKTIYYIAIENILKSPIIGHGIGYFESLGFNYPHNIILELLLDFGVLGIMIMIFIIIKFIQDVGKLDSQKRCLFMLVFFVGEMILNFSSTIWLYPPFWLLLFMVFSTKNYE